MHYWHEVLPQRYGVVERFNHGYAVRRSGTDFVRTLEVGAGIGGHLQYERLTPAQRAAYYALELRENMVRALAERYPDVQAIQGDCQARLDFDDGHFDRILAIHVLEHLPNLPAAIAELRRLCAPGGRFYVLIPCDPGWAYGLARRISAQRIFERRYRQSYRWFYRREHINAPQEIIAELERAFEIVDRTFFPLRVPAIDLNLCIGLTLQPRSGVGG
jgi:SAM-dependent methyltransferase